MLSPILWLTGGGGGGQSALIITLLHAQFFIPAPTQNASIGMYSGCDYPYKSCLCTFWPCYPHFILQFHFF